MASKISLQNIGQQGSHTFRLGKLFVRGLGRLVCIYCAAQVQAVTNLLSSEVVFPCLAGRVI